MRSANLCWWKKAWYKQYDLFHFSKMCHSIKSACFRQRTERGWFILAALSSQTRAQECCNSLGLLKLLEWHKYSLHKYIIRFEKTVKEQVSLSVNKKSNVVELILVYSTHCILPVTIHGRRRWFFLWDVPKHRKAGGVPDERQTYFRSLGDGVRSRFYATDGGESGGRKGRIQGLVLGVRKAEDGGEVIGSKQSCEFLCWFVWVVVITWFKSARSGQLLWPEEEHSSFTFGSSNCMETSVLSGSFFKWSPRITHHNKVWKRKMNEYRQYIFSWTMRIYV